VKGEWTATGASNADREEVQRGNRVLASPIISTRNVTAKRAQAGKASYLRVDTQAMKADPALYKHNVDLFKLARFYPGMRADEVTGSTDEIASHVINRMRQNRGIKGTYSLYTDAYRLAAKDLGLKPREVWTTADALAFGTRQSKTEHRLAETEGPFRMSRTGALRPGRPPGPLLASLHCPHRPRYLRAWGFHTAG
jgi:hypothetical protein